MRANPFGAASCGICPERWLALTQVRECVGIRFPVAAVEGFDDEGRDGRIEAADIDVDAIWV